MTIGPTNITPLILTYNEAPNIERTIARLDWAAQIIVLDSFSSDETVSLAERFPNVRVVERRFDDHVAQWNFGLQQVNTPWVLTLDADYILSRRLVDEIAQLDPLESVAGYWARFRYCVGGTALRGSLYPPRVVLFRRNSGQYVHDGHTQRLCVDGSTAFLAAPIFHDDRKPLSVWLREQNRYADLEAAKLLGLRRGDSKHARDRLRLNGWAAPIAVAIYCLFLRGLLLDGWRGVYYTLQRTYFEVLLALKLADARQRAGHHVTDSDTESLNN